MDEQIIGELADILRRPSDPETERARYRTVRIHFSATVWKPPEDVAIGTPLCGGPDPETGRVFVYDDNKALELIKMAFDGDLDAEGELLETAARYVEAGCALPPNLRDYAGTFLRSWSMAWGNNEGANKYTNFTRNLSIAAAAVHLRTKWGITNKAHANRLVRAALETIGVHISEDGVKKVLDRCEIDEATIAALFLQRDESTR